MITSEEILEDLPKLLKQKPSLKVQLYSILAEEYVTKNELLEYMKNSDEKWEKQNREWNERIEKQNREWSEKIEKQNREWSEKIEKQNREWSEKIEKQNREWNEKIEKQNREWNEKHEKQNREWNEKWEKQSKEWNEKWIAMKSEIKDVKTELADVKTEVKDMKAELENVKAEVKDIKTELADVKTEVKDMKAELASVKIEVKDMKTELENVKVSIMELKSAVGSIGRRIGRRQEELILAIFKKELEWRNIDVNQVKHLVITDEEGELFGVKNSPVEIDMYLHNGMHILFEIKHFLDEKEDIYIFYKKADFVDKKFGISSKKVIISVDVVDEVKTLAESLGIEVITGQSVN